MKLKMLMEMLSQYEDMIGSGTSEVGTGAQAELDAVVAMARIIVAANDTGDVPANVVEGAWNNLRELAKESP
jgi:hypothetical protein